MSVAIRNVSMGPLVHLAKISIAGDHRATGDEVFLTLPSARAAATGRTSATPALPSSEGMALAVVTSDPPAAPSGADLQAPAPVSAPAPAPRGDGPIAEMLPIDRDSLEAAVGRFLGRFEELAGPGESRPPWFSPSLMLGIAAVVLEIARRRLRPRPDDAKALESDRRRGRRGLVLEGFPELPGSWSERRP